MPGVKGTPFRQSSGRGHVHLCAHDRWDAHLLWGNSHRVVSDKPAGTFTQVSAGGSHTCALKTDGTLHCWGDNTVGQVSNKPAGTFTQVNAGDTMRVSRR
ncbi:MAG: hypothetical protein ACRDH5_01075 [bacterium]